MAFVKKLKAFPCFVSMQNRAIKMFCEVPSFVLMQMGQEKPIGEVSERK